MTSLWERLRRRKLFQWAAAYVAAAWAALQGLDLIGARFHWPDWVLQSAIALLVVGLLVTLVLAWYHGERGRQRVGGTELIVLAALLLLAGGTVAYLRARADTSASGPASATLPGRPEPAPGSVAVLAFRDQSPAGDQAFFAEGVADEILSSLMTVPGLRVAARTSAFAFTGADTDVRTIGDTLGVRYVLEGSVLREGDRVRIRAHLVDTRDGFRAWSNTYERTVAGVIDAQRAIARAVVGELQVELTAEVTARMAGRYTEVPAAYESYLRGRYHQLRRLEGLEQAREHFERATALDSTFAEAFAQLSRTYSLLGLWNQRPTSEVFPPARAAARRALSLDSALAEAHLALAAVRGGYDWEWDAAGRGIRRGIQLKPNLPDGHHQHAYWLMAMGRFEESVAEARTAWTLDPLSPFRSYILVEMLRIARRNPEALALVRRELERFPEEPGLMSELALVEATVGDADRGIAVAERLLELTGDRLPLAFASAVAGRDSTARSQLARFDPNAVYPGPGAMAVVHAHLGDVERAFALLELAVERRSSWLFQLNDPLWDPVRHDPRLAALARRANLRLAPAGGA